MKRFLKVVICIGVIILLIIFVPVILNRPDYSCNVNEDCVSAQVGLSDKYACVNKNWNPSLIKSVSATTRAMRVRFCSCVEDRCVEGLRGDKLVTATDEIMIEKGEDRVVPFGITNEEVKPLKYRVEVKAEGLELFYDDLPDTLNPMENKLLPLMIRTPRTVGEYGLLIQIIDMDDGSVYAEKELKVIVNS